MIERLAAVKRANKTALSRFVHEQTGAPLDPTALFDVHIKRIHEYKRQLLNLLDTVARYHAIRADPGGGMGAAGQDLRRQGRRQLCRRPR